MLTALSGDSKICGAKWPSTTASKPSRRTGPELRVSRSPCGPYQVWKTPGPRKRKSTKSPRSSRGVLSRPRMVDLLGCPSQALVGAKEATKSICYRENPKKDLTAQGGRSKNAANVNDYGGALVRPREGRYSQAQGTVVVPRFSSRDRKSVV